MIYKNGKLKKMIKDGKNVKSIYKGHVKIWPSKESLYKYIVPNGEWKAGDVVLFSKRKGLKFAVSPENIDRFDSQLFSPIGVVVIPQSHDVYGNGCAGVISLKYMNCAIPDNGSTFASNMYYGYYTETVASLLNYFTSYQSSDYYRYYFYHYGACTTTPKTTTSGNTYRYIYFPSNKFTRQQYPNDSRLKYNSDVDSSSTYYWGISPYKNDDTKNADFNKYCGMYFNGKQYQNIWLSLITTSNWKTSSTISNTYSQQGHYPPFMCAWRYSTEGTNQGDWFIPSYPEFIYMLPKFNEIYNAFTKVYRHFWNLYPPSLSYTFLCSNYAYFNSGEWKNCQLTISLSSGLYAGGYKYSQANYALAFTQIKGDDITHTTKKYSLKVNINEGIQSVIVYINGTYNVVKSTTILSIPEYAEVSWEFILNNGYTLKSYTGKISSFESNYIINEYPELNGVPINLNWDHIAKYLINGKEPISGARPIINWQTLKGTWNESSSSDAYDNKLFTCVSPGANKMTILRCSFINVKSITFTYRSDAEYSYDYLLVGKLDNDLTTITSWFSTVYKEEKVQDNTHEKQGIWRSYTYEINDNNEHFVDFMFGKDAVTDTQPDNAKVYISKVEYEYNRLDTVYYPKDTQINWSAEPEIGYVLENSSGNFTLTQETTLDPKPKAILIPLHLLFKEGVAEIKVNDVSYYENTTINFVYGTTITWNGIPAEGYSIKLNTGNFILTEEQTLSPDAVLGNVITNEIHYRTTNNSTIPDAGSFGKGTLISNVYDENLGYCIMTFDDDVTYLPANVLASTYLYDIIYLPPTIETIDINFVTFRPGVNTVFNSTMNEFNIGDLPNLTTIGNNFISGMYVAGGNEGGIQWTINKVTFGEMTSLESVGSYFLGSYSAPPKYYFNAYYKINELILPHISRQINVGPNSFDLLTVNNIYCHNDDYTYWANILPTTLANKLQILPEE